MNANISQQQCLFSWFLHSTDHGFCGKNYPSNYRYWSGRLNMLKSIESNWISAQQILMNCIFASGKILESSSFVKSFKMCELLFAQFFIAKLNIRILKHCQTTVKSKFIEWYSDKIMTSIKDSKKISDFNVDLCQLRGHFRLAGLYMHFKMLKTKHLGIADVCYQQRNELCNVMVYSSWTWNDSNFQMGLACII